MDEEKQKHFDEKIKSGLVEFIKEHRNKICDEKAANVEFEIRFGLAEVNNLSEKQERFPVFRKGTKGIKFRPSLDQDHWERIKQLMVQTTAEHSDWDMRRTQDIVYLDGDSRWIQSQDNLNDICHEKKDRLDVQTYCFKPPFLDFHFRVSLAKEFKLNVDNNQFKKVEASCTHSRRRTRTSFQNAQRTISIDFTKVETQRQSLEMTYELEIEVDHEFLRSVIEENEIERFVENLWAQIGFFVRPPRYMTLCDDETTTDANMFLKRCFGSSNSLPARFSPFRKEHFQRIQQGNWLFSEIKKDQHRFLLVFPIDGSPFLVSEALNMLDMPCLKLFAGFFSGSVVMDGHLRFDTEWSRYRYHYNDILMYQDMDTRDLDFLQRRKLMGEISKQLTKKGPCSGVWLTPEHWLNKLELMTACKSDRVIPKG
eukprot:TRINITY_DN752_c0_g2_i3.p1 TRINITY_DN752_c0_g2~~TRINITY_DN752_c0_g2_i3.p1  ORF type:complete len:425 (-),score=49.02 TRINITY_DN752_c0_g2_i3:1201-2475(-)